MTPQQANGLNDGHGAQGLFQTWSPGIWLLPGLFNVAECATLKNLAEQHGFVSAGVRTSQGEQAMPLVRNNDRTVLEHPQWVEQLWQRWTHRTQPCSAIWQSALGEDGMEPMQPVGLPRALRFYRYGPGQRFKMHKDGPWHEDGLSSRLTLLVYLNDDFEGGATTFKSASAVQPQTGLGLVFEHPLWHEGSPVTRGHKWVLRSDVMFGPRPVE